MPFFILSCVILRFCSIKRPDWRHIVHIVRDKVSFRFLSRKHALIKIIYSITNKRFMRRAKNGRHKLTPQPPHKEHSVECFS